MGFRTDDFSAITGLQYDPKARTFWGTVLDYPVFLHLIRMQNTVIMNLTGKFPGENPPQDLPLKLDDLKSRNPLIVDIRRQDRRFLVHLMIPAKDAAQAIGGTVRGIAAFARELGLLPCCAICGREEGYEPYLLNSDGYPICERCTERVTKDLEKENQKRDQIRGRTPGQLLGAFAGAAAVFAVTWFAAGHFGISVLTAVAGVMLGMFLMNRLGKALTLQTAALCGMLCLIASFSAICLHTAQEIAKTNRTVGSIAEIVTDYGGDSSQFSPFVQAAAEHQTTGKCLRDLPELMEYSEYAEIESRFRDNLLYGFLSVAAGTVISAYPYLRESRRRFCLRKPVTS